MDMRYSYVYGFSFQMYVSRNFMSPVMFTWFISAGMSSVLPIPNIVSLPSSSVRVPSPLSPMSITKLSSSE